MNEAILLAQSEVHKTSLERLILSKAILDQLRGDRYLSRLKLMSIFYLVEHHLQLENIKGIYYRTANGPANYSMLKKIEFQLERMGWYRTDDEVENLKDASYEHIDKPKQRNHYVVNVPDWYDIDGLTYLVKQMKPMDSEQTLMISSIYAVWNDLKISGRSFTDREIIDEVMNQWINEIILIPKFRWQNTMAWLRSVELIPTGFGKPTRML